VKESSSAVSLRLKLDIGICESICIPAEARVALDIPRGLRASVPSLDAAEARVPAREPGKSANLRILATKLERAKTRALVDVAVPQNQPFDLFAEGPSEAWALPLPELIDSGNGRARFAIPMEGAPAGAGPTPASLRLTLVAGGEAIEVVAPLD
jgi:DsbC/DsbD-like thiol-disulfide interchange protein